MMEENPMTTCPKCQYQRKPQERAPQWQCPSCGVAYSKVLAAQRMAAAAKDAHNDPEIDSAANPSAPTGKRKIAISICALLVLFLGIRMVGAFNHRKAASSSTSATAIETPTSPSTHDYSLPGFQGIAWGARDDAIKAKFGAQLTLSNPPVRFSGAHANFTIEKYNLDGVLMKVSFQMSDGPEQLRRVLLAKTTGAPAGQNYQKAYAKLLDQLTQKLGKPTCVKEFDCKWLRGDTVIELDYLYQANILENLTVMYRPAIDR
ncbi:MAG: hypothetical protein CFE44_01070 [Burkholderiales bacterium PBB4]|nr:MAG: hypothetical protein CFE44_01070 [Burkholderiales bacterium PBB4]